MKRPVRIANTSAFYGDRLAAMRELIAAADVDVITGDYLAELTMLILWKAKQKDPESGYARTFLIQFKQVVNECAARGVKVITNAGGLNPAGMADAVRAVIADAGVSLSVAYVGGDDLMPQLAALRAAGTPFTNLDSGVDFYTTGADPVSANAYLGGWGIARALAGGADIVITGRVTDAALVVGAGGWWHDWSRTDYDALAGAVAAGHIIECGPQATGGNYSQLAEIADRRYPGSPIAELAYDGSFVITKPDDTGGLVSPGTVIAQLLYEVDAPAYVNPDVVAHFDTLAVEQDGPDRVRVSGATGSPPPATLKGFHTTTPPTSASEFGVYWPTVVPADAVTHTVVHADGTAETIPHSTEVAQPLAGPAGPAQSVIADFGPTSRSPLGSVIAARSGDKGGNANVGLWTDTDERWDWLRSHLTIERFTQLVPEAAGLPVRRYEFPNLKALNFVIVGFLGEGVASCTRTDPQAKGLGEYVRALHTDIPEMLKTKWTSQNPPSIATFARRSERSAGR
jgi:hypothetical protein